MLFLMIIFILIRVTEPKKNAGTAIFYNRIKGDCWNSDDIVKLRARRAFERLVPPQVNPNDIDANYIHNVLRYFQQAIHSMDKAAQPHTNQLLKEAVSDTIGAHLRCDILPAVRFAYYAGYISYRNAREIHNFYDDIKVFLNTQGLGWQAPKRNQDWSNLTVSKILIGAGTFFDPCTSLVIKRDSKNCIHLPIPKQDNEQEPSAIALPFKKNGLISLHSPDSSNVLSKYYTTASRCILSCSPEKCRHADFVSFNNELWHWMKRDVAPHLSDEKLYTAYGGILRIAASVQNYGKGLSRRNLFENEDSGTSKWHPWRSLTQSYVYVNKDWTPQMYVGLVLMTAITIYLLQMCYGYIAGDTGGCNCEPTGYFGLTKSNEQKLTTVMPFQSAVFYSDKRKKRYSRKSGTASSGSIKREKVYDLNENTEKLMEVIMSSSEESAVTSSTSGSRSEGEHIETIRAKSPSPPLLETSISELTVDRKTGSRTRVPCASSHTDTLKYGSPKASESQSSGSESSSSSRSGSSTSKSGSSRDLAWARKVISRHSSRTKTSSGHEPDRVSYTTTTNSR